MARELKSAMACKKLRVDASYAGRCKSMVGGCAERMGARFIWPGRVSGILEESVMAVDHVTAGGLEGGARDPSGITMDHQLGYNAYQRALYAESPSSIAAAIAHPTPHPPVPQFINDPHTLPHGLSANLPIASNDENNIYALVIDLLDPESREAALLDLSKKREQYDDLALVLWHAFGQPYFPVITIPRHYYRLTLIARYHASSPPGDRICIPNAFPAKSHGTCIQPRLQCPRAPPMCRISSRDTTTLFKRYLPLFTHACDIARS